MSLYQQLKDAGCEMDHHESDLYVKATATAKEITKREGSREFFHHQVTGELWIDLPFRYEPFWEKVRERGGGK